MRTHSESFSFKGRENYEELIHLYKALVYHCGERNEESLCDGKNNSELRKNMVVSR